MSTSSQFRWPASLNTSLSVPGSKSVILARVAYRHASKAAKARKERVGLRPCSRLFQGNHQKESCSCSPLGLQQAWDLRVMGLALNISSEREHTCRLGISMCFP